MTDFPVQPHRTSFGMQANKLVMLLYILAIFGGICSFGCFWGFWAVALIFYLAEKSSPYFRHMTCQLTVLLFLESAVTWLLNIPNTISTISRTYNTIDYVGNNLSSIDPSEVDDIIEYLTGYAGEVGIYSGISSFLTSVISIFVLVVLIIGAVKASKGFGWELPLVSKLSRWVDAKLHHGESTF